MHRSEVDRLDPRTSHWVPAVVSPCRDWSAMPGCRRGARFMVDAATLRLTRDEFQTFASRLECLSWIIENRAGLNVALPNAEVRPVALDRWLLGLE